MIRALKIIHPVDIDRLDARREKAFAEISAEHEREGWAPVEIGYGGPAIVTDEVLQRATRYVLISDQPLPWWRKLLRWRS